MKKYSLTLNVLFLFFLLPLHSEEKDITNLDNPLANASVNLVNPMKAEVTLEKSTELADLFSGKWFAEKKDTECSGGGAIKGNPQKTIFFHNFDPAAGTYLNSVINYDENRNITSIRESVGTFEIAVDDSEDPKFGFYFKARITKYRDATKGPYTPMEKPIFLIFFIDPVRSNKNTLVLGYPQPKGNQSCPQGEVPILKFKRPQ